MPDHFDTCLGQRFGQVLGLQSTIEALDHQFTAVQATVGCALDVEVPIEPAPLDELCNHDAAALYAAFALADYTSEGPVEFELVRRAIAIEAVAFCRWLRPTSRSPFKLDKLFPAGARDMRSSLSKYEDHAIGRVVKGTLRGCLFQWRIASLWAERARTLVALTPQGADLIRSLRRITIRQPHKPEDTRTFLAHLASHAPDDLCWLMSMCLCAADCCSSKETETSFKDWGVRPASEIKGAYLARCREWGLIEPEVSQGQYTLTGFGRKMFKQYGHFKELA